MPETTNEVTKKQVVGSVRHPYPTRGYSVPPSPGITTWRRMRGNPTIALTRVIATSPILLQGLSITVKDDAQGNAVKYVQDYIKPLASKFINDLLLSLDYGFSAFEKVFDIQDGYVVYKKLKYLDPAMTVLEQDDYGNFIGVKQGTITLSPDESILYTYGKEADNLYGNPRAENVRLAWSQWMDLVDLEGVYIKKVANIIPVVHFPSDESFENIDGDSITAYEAAESVVKDLANLKGVVIPQSPIGKQAQALLNAGIDPAQLKPWSLSFVEASGGHGTEIADAIRAKEVQMVRGWLMPERAILEGSHGTLAESESQTSTGLNATQIVMNDVLTVLNEQVVKPMLMLNFGPDAGNSVSFSTVSVKKETWELMENLLLKTIESADRYNLLQNLIDVDALIDALGLTKKEEVL
jgi:hypothetical protein